MGFIDRVKGAISAEDGEEQGSEDIAEDFEDEIGVEEEMESLGGELEEPEEEETETWETAYRFSEDMIEPAGFANMKDFIGKLMYYHVSNSPKYRDRLEHGARTIEMVSQSMERMETLSGDSESSDFGKLADKLEAADRAVQAADSLSGREEIMTQDLINLGYEAVNSIGGAVAKQTGDVDSSVTESNREI
jgi:hypothetical protein